MTPVRVLLVDDQALFREALVVLLAVHDDIEVVGEAGDGDDALLRAAALTPDVVLMDLRMPVLDGVAATRRSRGFAYDRALTDLAATTDVATARWTAKVLELPTDGVTLTGPAWPWAPTAVLAALAVLSALTVILVASWLRWLQQRPRPGRVRAVSSTDRRISAGAAR